MKKLTERIIARGNWLSLKEETFESDTGARFSWESVDRVKSKKVVIIYARMMQSDRIILISQYRPVIGNRVIALPAGFVDSDTPENAALRELREETGYVGNIREVSPPLVVNSALVDDRLQLVEIDVDETDPRNIDPKQELEPSEEIEVMLVPRLGVKQFVKDKVAEGFDVGSGLWYLFCVDR